MGIDAQFQLRNDTKMDSELICMPPSLSVPFINAQTCDAKMKMVELTCKSSAACGLSAARSLITSGDLKKTKQNCKGT